MLAGRLGLPPRPLLLARHWAHELRVAHRRSPEWPHQRLLWLAKHPACTACGALKLPEVHHVTPFEKEPRLELVPSNFITLCHWNGCHLLIGHGDNFRFFNPWVRKTVAAVAEGRMTLKQAAEAAEDQRLPIHARP